MIWISKSEFLRRRIEENEKYMACEWQIQLNIDNHGQYMYIGFGIVIIQVRSISMEDQP